MRSRPFGFWTLADHESARVFGRRHWRWFVGFRILRHVAPVLLALALVSGLVLAALWWAHSGLALVPQLRKLGLPVWALVAAPVSGLALVLLRKSSRRKIRSARYKIGI
jgi:uncharacterized membrane protein affecting hemolysin expression